MNRLCDAKKVAWCFLAITALLIPHAAHADSNRPNIVVFIEQMSMSFTE